MPKDSMNSILIPGELADPKKRKGLGYESKYEYDPTLDKELGTGDKPASPFKQAPNRDQNIEQSSINKSAAQTAAKTDPKLVTNKVPQKLDSDNYRKAYMMKKRLQEDTAMTRDINKSERDKKK